MMPLAERSESTTKKDIWSMVKAKKASPAMRSVGAALMLRLDCPCGGMLLGGKLWSRHQLPAVVPIHVLPAHKLPEVC